MSIEEIKRTSVFSKLQAKALTQQQAADDLGITTRQVRRLFKSYKKQGPITLVSKKRGRPSNHQLANGVQELVLAIIQER
jgi:predicted ArsR family transcriptional regulator